MFCPIFLGSMKINLVFICDENPQKYIQRYSNLTWLFTFAFPDQGDSRPKPHHQHNNKEKITFCLPSSLSKKMFVNFWWNVEDKTHSVPLSLKSESDLIVEIIAVAVREERGEFLWWQVSVTECSKNAEQSSSFLPWFNYTETSVLIPPSWGWRWQGVGHWGRWCDQNCSRFVSW